MARFAGSSGAGGLIAAHKRLSYLVGICFTLIDGRRHEQDKSRGTAAGQTAPKRHGRTKTPVTANIRNFHPQS
jgi:hypothetical protein